MYKVLEFLNVIFTKYEYCKVKTLFHKHCRNYEHFKTFIPRSNIPATGSHMILQETCGKVTGSHRKAPEIAGSGSSIPTGNLLDFFPVDSDQFPVLSSRNRSEIIGKNPKIFRLEYCFHVPVTSGAFLPEPARIFRPG